MLHSTKGIVLRNVKYGETSLVVTIYTELFGVQSYIVNGIRTEKKTASKANIYQPTTILDLIVYHTPNKNLQRIKEARVHHIYQHVYESFVKNTIAIYLTELIFKTISEPETNEVLYTFFEESFLKIECKPESELANLPIEFTLDLASLLGFGIQNQYAETSTHLDLINGLFCTYSELTSLHYIDGQLAKTISDIANHTEITDTLNQHKRKELLNHAIQYLRMHIPHLGELRSVNVLHEMMS